MEPIKATNKGSFDRHMRAVRLRRYRDVCKAMPEHKDEQQQMRRKRYAWFVVNQTNRQQLARVIWPWQKQVEPKRPPDESAGRFRRMNLLDNPARVMRGRLSNPTALR